MPQVGVYSASLLMAHNHLTADLGGILNDYSRDGAYRTFYRTGAGLVHTSGGAAGSTNLAVMTMIKQLRIDETRPGQCIISFDYWSTMGGLNHVDARVYVNGVAVGVLQHGAGPATSAMNYDVGFTSGDTVEIWGRRYTAGDVCNIDNFFLEYDWQLTRFGQAGNVLAAPLALTDADQLKHTEIL